MDISKSVFELGIIGSKDPRKMPDSYFSGALFIDYDNAIPADVSKQLWTVIPRHWYVECDFLCAKCHQEFTWTVAEQKVWFEAYRLWVDAIPRHCKKCIATGRRLDDLGREYDASVAAARNGGTLEQKRRIIEIVHTLQESLSHLPQKMLDTLRIFERQTEEA